MSSTLGIEIALTQLDEMQNAGELTPSAGLRTLLDVSSTHPKVVRKKVVIKRNKNRGKKRRRLAK